MDWVSNFKFLTLFGGSLLTSIAYPAPISVDFSTYTSYVKEINETNWNFHNNSFKGGLSNYICTPVSNKSDFCYIPHDQQFKEHSSENFPINFKEQVLILSTTYRHIETEGTFTFFDENKNIFDDESLSYDFISKDVSKDQPQKINNNFNLYDITAEFVSNVPEPASMALLGLGLALLGGLQRKKRTNTNTTLNLD